MRAKVLVVEDDAVIAMSMREILSLVGFEVVGVAATVTDALCLAENTKPDVAILDVRLAGRRDGIEGAMLLRQRSGLPVIFVTAQSDKATVARAANCRARRISGQARARPAADRGRQKGD
jgi:two-component system, response regulator PdtaR